MKTVSEWPFTVADLRRALKDVPADTVVKREDDGRILGVGEVSYGIHQVYGEPAELYLLIE